jgi:hypothetical protein
MATDPTVAELTELRTKLGIAERLIEELAGRIAGRERPEVEAQRNRVRASFTEIIAQAEQDRDYEGAFTLQCQLRDRENEWAREDRSAEDEDFDEKAVPA